MAFGFIELLLLLVGFGALTWGLISIIRRIANRGPVSRRPKQVPLPHGPASKDTGLRFPEQPPLPPAPTAGWTVQVKEIVAIIGGIVSILVGVLTIIEKMG